VAEHEKRAELAEVLTEQPSHELQHQREQKRSARSTEIDPVAAYVASSQDDAPDAGNDIEDDGQKPDEGAGRLRGRADRGGARGTPLHKRVDARDPAPDRSGREGGLGGYAAPGPRRDGVALHAERRWLRDMGHSRGVATSRVNREIPIG